ncbi:MAG: phosphotransferase [Planctomycetota bacterium]|nr:phosphotransferase [Planctomycetota bacterium]
MNRPLEPDELRGLLALEIQTPLRRLQGRETFLHRTAAGDALVVKRSQPGARPGGRREHEALVRLADLGFPVPASLGFAAGPEGSVVAMERVPHAETARDRLACAPRNERRELLARVADLLARLHLAGWRHRDFYAHHLLLREPDRALVLIDVGRAGRAPIPRWRWCVKDAGALVSSLPSSVGAREVLEFLARYLDGRGLDDRGARRRFARAALAKARRIARRTPRDERATAPR